MPISQQQQPNSMGLPRTRRPPPLTINTPVSCPSSALPSAVSVDEQIPSHPPPQKARSLRNMKNLSIALPSPHESISEPKSAISGKMEIPSIQAPRPRRPSIISLPSSSNALGLLRKDEDGSPTVPYADGPIQIIPGIWLGSEDNARDWKGLVERGIKSILNVAKEVVSPFDPIPASQPLRPFASTPNLKASESTLHPPNPSSGRPAMRYLKLQWSHGQHDLVDNGFPEAMKFTDAALARHEGVLIHCQCGISRSATMVIALVMRAAAESSPAVPPEVWALKGMQGAYDYVKERSRWVGPNMSLIYQLLEYERRLKGPAASPSASSRSSAINEEEEEWGRQRRLLDEASSDPEEQQPGHEVMREALALDKAMEDRVIARQSSHSSLTSTHSGQGVGMGAAWRSRYGFGRKRTGSVASNFTTNSGSVLSEDLVEEDEEQELLGVGGGFDRSSSGEAPSPDSSPSEAESKHGIPPPSAPVWKTSFDPPAPPMTAVRSSFMIPKNPKRHQPPSLLGDVATTPRASVKSKKRPAPLGILPPVPPSPIALVQEDASPTTTTTKPPLLALTLASPDQPAPRTRKRTESRKPAPPPLHLRNPKRGHTSSVSIDSTSTSFSSESTTSQRSRTSSHSSSQNSQAIPPPTATQTLFVFPPSPTMSKTRTPSTMTLLSNAQAVPFPMITPRVSSYQTQNGRRRSFIGVGVPPTPTTACSRVDARGWFGVE